MKKKPVYISPATITLLERNALRRAWWAWTDWHATLEDIEWESEIFHNDIPFSGDVRAYIIKHPERPR